MIYCTNTLSVDSVQQARIFNYLSGLYCHSERLMRTTSKSFFFSSVFCISFPRLAHRLIYSLFLKSQLQCPKFPLIWSAGRYKSLTPASLPTSSIARSNPISYNIKDTEVGPFEKRRYVLIPTSYLLISTERSLHYSV